MNGFKLKRLRENKGLLQKELGSALNISPSTIGMYEQGRREPDNLTLRKIANFFEVSVDYLLDNEKNLNKNEKVVQRKDTLINILKENNFINENEDLTDEEIKKLIEFVKTNKKFIKDDK